MPTTDAIIWAAIAGLIVVMLGIIGYLISTGFNDIKVGIKEQFKTLWDKLDQHHAQGEANALEIAMIKSRCEERHANHRRESD
jgi:hypothetical protein